MGNQYTNNTPYETIQAAMSAADRHLIQYQIAFWFPERLRLYVLLNQTGAFEYYVCPNDVALPKVIERTNARALVARRAKEGEWVIAEPETITVDIDNPLLTAEAGG